MGPDGGTLHPVTASAVETPREYGEVQRQSLPYWHTANGEEEIFKADKWSIESFAWYVEGRID